MASNIARSVANHASAWPFNHYSTGALATFPIAGYDEKNVDEISARLDGLSAEQIRHLRAYEKANKNRQSLIDRFDNKLRAL